MARPIVRSCVGFLSAFLLLKKQIGRNFAALPSPLQGSVQVRSFEVPVNRLSSAQKAQSDASLPFLAAACGASLFQCEGRRLSRHHSSRVAFAGHAWRARKALLCSRCKPPEDSDFGVSAAGIVASLIVLWSEYTLKTTGKGLPGDLLGGLEGVSYLVVLWLSGWSIASRISTGAGLSRSTSSLIGVAEGLSLLAVAVGLVVLYFQISDIGVLDFAPFPLKIDFRAKDG
eukprot:TRINITY_DN66729_c0_g1_i1.p1 TRINITY_DN66729_c0_g1~~TRINITY_DN66729_c0_g1_i1.p1  ORF type:complete len:229 (-),score=25.86 TRINITY_DN66729_c0_g1_i1:129-815(-)